MEIGNDWHVIQELFVEAFKSSLHFAFATVNDDGSPHVTPIGALFLRDNMTGFYFEEYPTKMCENLKRNPRVCILAVNADKKYWSNSLVEGKFASPPAVRLMGVVGEARRAGREEISEWQKRFAFARDTKGYKLMWEQMETVRDITFDSFEPVNIGEMTRGSWLQ